MSSSSSSKILTTQFRNNEVPQTQMKMTSGGNQSRMSIGGNKYLSANLHRPQVSRVKMSMNNGGVSSFRTTQMNSMLGSQYTIKHFAQPSRQRTALHAVQANAAVLEKPKVTLEDLKLEKDIPRGKERKPYNLKVGDKVHD